MSEVSWNLSLRRAVVDITQPRHVLGKHPVAGHPISLPTVQTSLSLPSQPLLQWRLASCLLPSVHPVWPWHLYYSRGVVLELPSCRGLSSWHIKAHICIPYVFGAEHFNGVSYLLTAGKLTPQQHAGPQKRVQEHEVKRKGMSSPYPVE